MKNQNNDKNGGDPKFEDIAKAFDCIIGQEKAKARLIQSAQAFARGGAAINPLFTGLAGLGKTFIIKAYINALEIAYAIRSGAKDIATQSLFYNTPHDFRLLGGEFSTLRESVQNIRPLFLAIDELADFGSQKTVQLATVYSFIKHALGTVTKSINVSYGIRWDDELSIQLRKCDFSIIGGTNFPEKLPDGAAMRSRFSEIALELYTQEELNQIAQVMLKAANITTDEKNTMRIAKTGRGTARPLARIVETLASLIISKGKSTRTINREETIECLRLCDLFPLGLNIGDIKLLQVSKDTGNTSTSLALMLGLEKQAIAKSIAFLCNLQFITVTSGKVKTSTIGNRYITSVKADGFKLPE
jgi:Holliday junction resolvasome RuvABC ATP-dependent DNA helicase subunit